MSLMTADAFRNGTCVANSRSAMTVGVRNDAAQRLSQTRAQHRSSIAAPNAFNSPHPPNARFIRCSLGSCEAIQETDVGMRRRHGFLPVPNAGSGDCFPLSMLPFLPDGTIVPQLRCAAAAAAAAVCPSHQTHIHDVRFLGTLTIADHIPFFAQACHRD